MSLRKLYAILFTFMTIGGMVHIIRIITLRASNTTTIPTVIFTAVALFFAVRFWRKEPSKQKRYFN